jgi:hypothetical protein
MTLAEKREIARRIIESLLTNVDSDWVYEFMLTDDGEPSILDYDDVYYLVRTAEFVVEGDEYYGSL